MPESTISFAKRRTAAVALALFFSLGAGCARTTRIESRSLVLASPGLDGTASAGPGQNQDPGDSGPGSPSGPPHSPVPEVSFPRTGIQADELAVIVNDNDPQSVAVAAYYQKARAIPAANVIHASFTAGTPDLTAGDFAQLKGAIDGQLSAKIQAYALTWTFPFRVNNCMSITAAFTFGYQAGFCSSSWPTNTGCKTPTGENGALYLSATTAPFTDLALRPAMMIAGSSTAAAEAVIDRGVAANGSLPKGTSYLLRTTDVARSSRWGEFTFLNGGTDFDSDFYGNPPEMSLATTRAWDAPATGVGLDYIDNSLGSGSDYLTDAKDVLFYLTGGYEAQGLQTNTYLPGALGDLEYSYGGILDHSFGPQTVLDWLYGPSGTGVTASYGTVVEPCTFITKFPDAIPLMTQYYQGATAIEAYWKSVASPYEGLFVGEPLARPFGSAKPFLDPSGNLQLQTTGLLPGTDYVVEGASAVDATFTAVGAPVSVTALQRTTIEIDNPSAAAYRLRAL